MQQQYKEYNELMQKGYEFDIIDECFYVPYDMIDTFKLPKGYEDWAVSAFIFNSEWEKENKKKLAKFEKKPFIRDQYLKERLNDLGIKDSDQEENFIDLNGGSGAGKNQITKNKIFNANKHGDIEILLYSLKRKPFIYTKDSANKKGGSKEAREEEAVLTRHHPRREIIFNLDKDNKKGKYDFDKSKTGNHLMWHPHLIELYENNEEVETLVLTEGFFKAFKAVQDGIPTVGLPSITIFTEKKGLEELHPEIVDFIETCNVKNVVILWDADCRNISGNALQHEEDLYERPAGFVRMASKLRRLIRLKFNAKSLNIHFGRIRDEDEGVIKGSKGLDDLLIDYASEKENIKNELIKLPKSTYFIKLIDISTDTAIKNVYADFYLNNVRRFYLFNEPLIKNREFVYDKSTFEIKDGEPVIKIPANVKKYIRVNNKYYKVFKKPFVSQNDKHSEDISLRYEEILLHREKQTISDDHGKDVFQHISRYDDFVNIPNHINYKQVIDSNWNLYKKLDHEPEEGGFTHITKLLKHVFQDHYKNDMILDYLTVLYKYPRQKLPIIALVSREQKTGKSTFVKLLQYLFQGNMANISSEDFVEPFNDHWNDKLVVACEETMFQKTDAYEKLKNMSLSDTSNRKVKGISAQRMDNNLHFVLCSNHEEDFIRIGDDDTRFWILKVPSITEKIKNFDAEIENEINQFVYFLEHREITYNYTGERMFFDPKDYRTEAFNNIVKNTLPVVEQELREGLERLFLDYNLEEVRLTTAQIKNPLFIGIKTNTNYLNRLIEKIGGYKQVKNGKTDNYKYHAPYIIGGEVKFEYINGRPWIFQREKITKEEVNIDPELKMNLKNMDSTKFEMDQEKMANEILEE